MNTIEVGLPRIDGRRVTIPLTRHGAVPGRFVKEDFWCEYSFPVGEIPPGILTVPAVASLLPFVWAEDVVLSVEVLDREFSQAIPSIREGWGVSIRVIEPRGRVDVVREANTENTGGTGAVLLFSGGVDSVASALRHEQEISTLFTIWGIDVAVGNQRGWDATWCLNRAMAERHGWGSRWVRSNLRDFLDGPALSRRYEHLLESWWHTSTGLSRVGQAVPAAVYDGVASIIISSTLSVGSVLPTGTSAAVEGAIRAAGVQVVHDAYEMTRIDKLTLIAERDPDVRLLVCVAGTSLGKNCGECEKCMRTAAGMLAASIDPQRHDIPVTKRRIKRFHRRFAGGRLLLEPTKLEHWSLVQAHIPPGNLTGPVAQVAFLKWLRSADLTLYRARRSVRFVASLRGLFGALVPLSLRPFARRVYLAVFRRW